jgi:DNA-binding Lrp family transcriptional regulator
MRSYGSFLKEDVEAKMAGLDMRASGPIAKLSIEQRWRLMGRFMFALDETNIQIITLMHRMGPRNLLEVARAAGLPPTTVYDRAHRLEGKFGVLSIANVDHSKIGLKKCITLVESNPGMEEYVTEALAVPNYWKTITRCEGGFTHYALHAIPEDRVREFEKYMVQTERGGLVRKHETVWVSDYYYSFPNFSLYDPTDGTWSFEWDRWTDQIKGSSSPKAIRDPTHYSIEADRADLLILAELEINARAKFSEISKILGITLQAVKHRYDKRISPRSLIKDFVINVLPHPTELSDMYEILLSFEDEGNMDAFFGVSQEMFPILRIVKVLGEKKLGVRAYSPRNETERLFAMLSGLARFGVVSDYSGVRIRPETQSRQMISTELFEDKVGWKYDSIQHLAALDAILEHAKVKV